MWLFRRKRSLVEHLRGYKKITVHGMRFTIKKVNPLIDFPNDKIPQIFTDFVSVRKAEPQPPSLQKVQEDMYSIIQAGVVDPDLKTNGITVQDLFRDPDIGVNLYQAILEHSLNRFKGLKRLFFSIRAKYKSYITWRKLTGHYQAQFYSRMGGSQT